MLYADSINRIYLDEMVLSHCDNYVIFCFALFIWHNTSIHRFPVHSERLYALLHVVGIHDFNIVGTFAELTGYGKVAKVPGNAGIDAETLMGGIYAENVLGHVQLFFASPGMYASAPATIWEYT